MYCGNCMIGVMGRHVINSGLALYKSLVFRYATSTLPHGSIYGPGRPALLSTLFTMACLSRFVYEFPITGHRANQLDFHWFSDQYVAVTMYHIKGLRCMMAAFTICIFRCQKTLKCIFVSYNCLALNCWVYSKAFFLENKDPFNQRSPRYENVAVAPWASASTVMELAYGFSIDRTNYHRHLVMLRHFHIGRLADITRNPITHSLWKRFVVEYICTETEIKISTNKRSHNAAARKFL